MPVSQGPGHSLFPWGVTDDAFTQLLYNWLIVGHNTDGTNKSTGSTTVPEGTLPTGAQAHTFPRWGAFNGTASLTSGQVYMTAIYLPSGITLSSISILNDNTSASAMTHQLFGLYDDNAGTSSGVARSLLRGTVDDTSTAWPGSTIKTLNLTSSYVTTRAGQFYLAVLVTATTCPGLYAINGVNNTLAALSPIISGSSNTGQTSLPSPANALSQNQAFFYGYVS